MIRLLIADDFALMRKLLEGIFLEEGDFDIRLARNGAEALELVRSFDPQVVTLDVQMPGMDGLACLGQIMIEAPRPVVMISALTEEGAEATLEAIELGAIDFIAKPGGAVSLEIDRLRPTAGRKGARRGQCPHPHDPAADRAHPSSISRSWRCAATTARRQHLVRQKAQNRLPLGLVLIGTSTGGPAALDIVLPQLPGGLSLAGAGRAAHAGELHRPVCQATRPAMRACGSSKWIARCRCSRVRSTSVGATPILIVAPRPTGMIAMPVPAQRDYPWHPSVERMVTSALEHYDATQLIGVLMTGMGRDGADAMTRLREQGGRTIAEAESTAVVWGMPGELVKNGGAEFVRPVEDIAATIVELVGAHAVR